MSSEDKSYEISDEGNAIIKRISERYPKSFKFVDPLQIVVLLVVNRPRPFTMKKLAKITKVDSAHRTLLRAFGRKDIRFIIEIYLTDWTTWNDPRKQWILAHELGHIGDPDRKSLLQHDCQDWSWLLDAVGIDWWDKDNLPDLLNGNPYPFRQELFDRLHVDGEGDDDAEGMHEGGDSHGGPWSNI